MKSGQQVRSGTKPGKATTTILSSPTLSQFPNYKSSPKQNPNGNKQSFTKPTLTKHNEDSQTSKMNGTIDQDKLFNFLWSIDEALERCKIPYVVLGQTAF